MSRASICAKLTDQHGHMMYLEITMYYIILMAMLDRIKHLLYAVATNTCLYSMLYATSTDSRSVTYIQLVRDIAP